MQDLSNLSITELVTLKNKIEHIIDNHKDGYIYICQVRSYGRNWVDKSIFNTYTLENLVNQYNGEDGIVDVFSTNPDLSSLINYGAVMYIESEQDYMNWSNWEKLKDTIVSVEEQLTKWETKDSLPFKYRPIFEPLYTRDELNELKKELEEYDMTFKIPMAYSYTTEQN